MQRHVFQSIACTLILSCCCWLAAEDKPAAVAALKLQQIISREDPLFNCARASLTIGRDGMVYLTSAGQDSGYILRVSRDGKDKLGGASLPAIHNATAGAGGLIAAAHAHFSHQAAIYDKQFQKTLAVTDFLVSDQVGWDAPAGVEAGTGGDFYGLDQHRDRILQINADGKIVRAYALPHVDNRAAQGFRVCEKTRAFYVLYYGKPEVQCLGFDGKMRWERSLGVSSNTYDGDSGGIDVDEDGLLYTIGPLNSVLRKTGPDGKPAGEVKLNLPSARKLAEGIHGMRVWDGEAVLRGRHTSELFQVYDLATGAFKHAVNIDHERLTVTAQGSPWTAGQPVDFRIEFYGGGQPIKPRWRVWARPFGVLEYRELKLADGKLLLLEGLAGIYQIKVTPESAPWQHGATASEYKVQMLVEVRAAGAQGSAAAATPLGRVDFGRGEEIPLAVYVRGNAPKGTELTLTLRDGAGTLAAAKAKFNPAAKEPLRSDSAVHTHNFAKPVSAARFRFVLPWGVCGNTRLAEIAFHGKVLGCSHPDVVAKRPLAVLFDEQEDIRHDLYSDHGFALSLEGAYSGGRCLTLTPPPGGQAIAGQPWQQQFGHTVRNWDFEIVENPQPGQYRWLQFAWKALGPETKGISLKLSDGGYVVVAGEPTAWEGMTIAKKVAAPPSAWRTVRVDLWAAAKKPWRVRSLALGAKGGGASFDQIVLGRTEQDLPAERK